MNFHKSKYGCFSQFDIFENKEHFDNLYGVNHIIQYLWVYFNFNKTYWLVNIFRQIISTAVSYHTPVIHRSCNIVLVPNGIDNYV